MRRSMFLASGFRLVTLPIGAVATFVSSATLIQSAGVTPYALISTIANLFQLLIFTDLGLGTVAVSLVSRANGASSADSPDLASLGRVFRILWASAGVISAIAVVVAALGAWPVILGTAGSPQYAAQLNWATAVAIVVFALSVPLGLGQRMLLGLGANHIVTIVGALTPVTTMVWTLGVVWSGAPVLLAGAGSSVGLLITSLIWTVISARKLELPWRVMLGMTTGTPIPIWAVAAPQLALALLAPLGTQTDRIVLSQLSGPQELASYSLVSQLWAPAVSVISVATVSLWPAYLKAGNDAGRLWRMSLWAVLGASSSLAVAFVLLAPVVCRFLSGSRVDPELDLLLAFGALTIVNCVHQVSSLLVMDAAGLRFQFICIVAGLAVNIPLTVGLTPVLGAAGPPVGTVVGVATCQLVPGIVYARRRIARMSGTPSPAAVPAA